jgi:hypothetical protein
MAERASARGFVAAAVGVALAAAGVGGCGDDDVPPDR